MNSIRSESPQTSGPRTNRPQPVASLTHTLVLTGIFVALAAGGAYMQGRGGSGGAITPRHPATLSLYLSVMVGEWALVYYVWSALRRRGIPLRELIGGEWRGTRQVLRDIAIAAGFWVVFKGTVWACAHLLGSGGAKSISTLLPEGPVEAVAWVALSVSAGFCEELVFRGYLLRQIWAWSGSPIVAVILQAIVFGIGHGYQGTSATITILVLGVEFALLAWWRRSLRPGMVAHAWADIFGGLIGR